MSFVGRYLPGTMTELRNGKQESRQTIWLLSPGRSQRARERPCIPNPNLSPLLKQPKVSVSITDFSPREFPNGQDGHSRRVASATGPLCPPPSLPPASTSPTQQFTPSGFPPPPPKPHQNQRISDCHHSKGLQRSPLGPGI